MLVPFILFRHDRQLSRRIGYRKTTACFLLGRDWTWRVGRVLGRWREGIGAVAGGYGGDSMCRLLGRVAERHEGRYFWWELDPAFVPQFTGHSGG